MVEQAPRSPAWLNLAVALKELGRLEDVEAACREALRLDPDFADAHNNLGNVLLARGRHAAAIDAFGTALRLRPADPNVACNRALALKLSGRVTEAVATLMATTAPLSPIPSFPGASPKPLRRPLRHTGRAGPIGRRGCSRTVCVSRASRQRRWNWRRPSQRSSITRRSTPPISCPRSALLSDPALRHRVPLAFLAALAHQCFLSEYVYAESQAETTDVSALAQEIAAGPCDAESVAMLACYRALGREPFAATLHGRPELAAIASVIVRQVSEPAEEAALAATLPSLAPIADDVSVRVREQYEENPYPRWCRLGLPEPRPFACAIRELSRGALIGAHLQVVSPRILVAGCGTGKHAILTASRYAAARVTAVDLSRASLAHGARQARRLGIRNIEFLQGDILELGRLESGFDLVESFGVLHHLRDPMAGWRVLADLVKPGGLMMIGLYSELARQPVVEARRLIAARGYPSTLEGIRQFRADLRASGDPAVRRALEQSVDFYSASGCRDLLFHVQEHRYTVPLIEASVRAVGLEFLGFEPHDATVLARYRERFPNDPSATCLANWDAFEQEHADTFAESYKFWLRKPGDALALRGGE
ncbi:MAG: methyltransferase domain-containing protein [Burkholderiales bacterium]